ncbi:hypothetical protein PAI11_44520 [Patulibacter medicamentivorans]|uniref:Uncharacterized protein n=1 Tax=Patulibacter medicamentivorans TaxID=1097667 RepID=H0EC53_9ACTN|nr:hypothetical protein PAI11_44520 [Patulibacter medicamentivorans]
MREGAVGLGGSRRGRLVHGRRRTVVDRRGRPPDLREVGVHPVDVALYRLPARERALVGAGDAVHRQDTPVPQYCLATT